MSEILLAFWQVLAMMAPWLLGGFILAGIAGVLMPREWAEKTMGKAKGWRGVLNAVLIGVPLPICSCGVLPLTQALREAGASKGAAAGFLISTPQTGIDSILATFALLGPVFAVARPLAAFMTGLFGGIAVNLMTRDEKVSSITRSSEKGQCHCCRCRHRHKDGPYQSHNENIVIRCLMKSDELFGEIVKPLTVGLVIAAILTVIVPENFFTRTLGGNDWLAMPLMVIIGFPMYVCSTASIPIAASMVAKGLSPGAALVFLMVGPAINAASLSTVATLIGKKPAIVYALVISIGAILCGIALNLMPLDLLPKVMLRSETGHLSLVEHIAACALILWIARGFLAQRGNMHCTNHS